MGGMGINTIGSLVGNRERLRGLHLTARSWSAGRAAGRGVGAAMTSARRAGARAGRSARIDVGGMHYRELNRLIREKAARGATISPCERVMGQRYIGAGLERRVSIEIHGVPGQDLGVFMGGARIEVHGNAQDGVGNTMNDGTVIIHGSVGDIPGHMVRNGRIFVKGSAGFRAGIMMKEYGRPATPDGDRRDGRRLPRGVHGRRGADRAVLGMGCAPEQGAPWTCTWAPACSGARSSCAARVAPHQLGRGAVLAAAGEADLEAVRPALEEFAAVFDLSLRADPLGAFPGDPAAGERPYGNLYVHGSKTIRNLKPLHRDLRAPCAAACPMGIPNPLDHPGPARRGGLREAFDLVDEYTPFRYSCCGMVCPGLCRAACSRNGLDSAVRIDEIARRYAPGGEVAVGPAAGGCERAETRSP